MLYYYRIKKRRSLATKKWLTTSLILALACIYFYSGLRAGVIPEINDYVLPSFSLDGLVDKFTAKSNKSTVNSGSNNMSIDDAKAFVNELKEEGKRKEAEELNYSLDLVTKISKDEPATETRVKTLLRDIEKTIGFFNAGNTASNRMQILGDYDGGNLAYVYYPNYGVHFNPVTTANMALEHYKKGNYKKVTEITDDLLATAIERKHPTAGKYYIWEYYFDLEFRNLTIPAPWTSGMAQGLILDTVGKSYKITGDKKYLIAGDAILTSFKVPWNEGGVTDCDEHGNWYLEIAATDKLRILNGFLFTLKSVYGYYRHTGNPKALALFNSGVYEAKAHLKDYDLGYWSNYSLLKGNLATYEYHNVHVSLLNTLHQTTGITEFKTYASKFDFYLKNRFIDVPPYHRSYKTISLLAEQRIITSRYGLFSGRNEMRRAEFIIWLTRLMKWKPATIYNGYYTDVRRDREDWGYIEAAYEKGLRFDKDGLFGPTESINRAEMASILCKALALKPGELTVNAVDIGSPGYSRDAIQLALSNGLMDVDKTGCFNPNLNVTKEEAANILYRCLSLR